MAISVGKVELAHRAAGRCWRPSRPGKRTRLRRLLYDYGPGDGTLLFLPIDQGIEHGPRDFFPNPASKDPEYQFRLAAEAGYSAIACGYGMASKYYPAYAGQVPLLLKLNSKTDVPPVRRGLLALQRVGRGRACGSAPTRSATRSTSARRRQEEDFIQLGKVRQDCDRFGMPLVIWAYPRGRDIEKKGGRDSFYAIDYAARVAMEMGADVVKLNMPKLNPEKDKNAPAPYNEMEVTQEEAIRHCVESAGRALVVLSGGSKVDDDKLLEQTRMIMEAGGSGVIFGRNVWQREWGAGARGSSSRSRRRCSSRARGSRRARLAERAQSGWRPAKPASGSCHHARAARRPPASTGRPPRRRGSRGSRPGRGRGRAARCRAPRARVAARQQREHRAPPPRGPGSRRRVGVVQLARARA